MNRSLATSIPSPRRRPPSSTVAPYLRIVLLFLNLCIKVFPHLFLQRCTLMHIILLADADEIDLNFLIVHRGKRCSKIYFVDFPPSSLPPRFDINHRRFAYLSRRSRKNRFRVYIFWTMACIFLEESFFSRGIPAGSHVSYGNTIIPAGGHISYPVTARRKTGRIAV